MMYQFAYKGGVCKPTEHSNEKFLLFLLVGEQEVPLYQATRDGVATRLEDGKEEFVTKHPVVKLFVSRKGFGLKDQYHSFWIKLDSDSPTLKIISFSGEKLDYYFRAKSRLMNRDEVLEVLAEESVSRTFVTRQEVLPINLMNQMVSIDRADMKAGIRYVKVGRKS